MHAQPTGAPTSRVMLDVGLYFLLFIFYFSLSFFYSSSSITFNPPLTLIRVLMVLGQHTYQILGELGMQGGKAWVRRAYSGALNGLKNGVVSVLWKSAIGPFSILVFLYIMFVESNIVYELESGNLYSESLSNTDPTPSELRVEERG